MKLLNDFEGLLALMCNYSQTHCPTLYLHPTTPANPCQPPPGTNPIIRMKRNDITDALQ